MEVAYRVANTRDLREYSSLGMDRGLLKTIRVSELSAREKSSHIRAYNRQGLQEPNHQSSLVVDDVASTRCCRWSSTGARSCSSCLSSSVETNVVIVFLGWLTLDLREGLLGRSIVLKI